MSDTPVATPRSGHQEDVGVPGVRASHRFLWALAGIVVIAIVVRILFIAGWAWGSPLRGGDPLFFQQSASYLANGKGYVDRFLGKGPLVPTAEHPPAFTFLLGGLDIVHVRSVDAHRIALACVSSLGVLAMGLLGRRLAGPRVGLLAAALAAVDPLFVEWGGFVMSESLYVVIVPTMLLFALRCLDRPNLWDFLALGFLVGVATLTRSEAVDFVVLLGAVVLILATGAWRQRIAFAVVFAVGLGLLLVPWVVRNDIQMGSPLLSTNEGLALSGSYSAGTISPSSPYYGSFDNDSQFGLAAVLLTEAKPPDHAQHWTELTLSDAMGSSAKSYARDHLSDLPGMVLAREGRVWGVYAPGSELAFDITEDGTGANGPKQADQIFNWVLLPFAIVGAVVLGRRSRRRLLIVLVPVVVVALNAAIIYGSTRLRVAAEPSIDVLAAISAVWLGGLLLRHLAHERSTGDGRESRLQVLRHGLHTGQQVEGQMCAFLQPGQIGPI
jgi:Dolichyl-phosphate-mannose-protein mannosyltransferase